MRGTMGLIGLAGVAAMSLAACDSKTVTAQNASTAEVAAKVKASGLAEKGFVSPGQWRMTMTFNDIQMPGLPPEAATRMKQAMGKPRSFDHCVTEEEAKKPKEDFFAGDESKSCRYEKFAMGSGTIDMVMTCSHGDGKQTVKMNGTYGPDAYKMAMVSTVEGKAGSPAAGMTFNATMDAKRIAPMCKKDAG